MSVCLCKNVRVVHVHLPFVGTLFEPYAFLDLKVQKGLELEDFSKIS